MEKKKKEKLTIIKDVNLGKLPNIIKVLSYKVMNDKAKFIDDEVLIVLKDKPTKMSQENWIKLIEKVIKIEYLSRF